MARRSAHNSCNPARIEPIFCLWLLRILVPLGAYREFVHPHGFTNDALAEVIGLGRWIDPEGRDFDQKEVQSELRQLHQQAERQCYGERQSTFLGHNIDQLSGLVGLSTIDCKVLEFTVSIHNERLLDDASGWLGDLSSIKIIHALSIILDLPEADIRASLSATGILAKSGLVMMDRRERGPLRYKLDLLSEGFADVMAASKADPISLLRGTVSAAGPVLLTLADYSHIQPLLEILCPYLRKSMTTGRRGVNIFMHGAPGTGKSQLARAFAKEMGYELFEVASEDADGNPINGEDRLRAFRAAQSFFSQQLAMIAFDEVEDVFNDGNSFFGGKSTAQLRKAWINRMLEENPVPTLWMSNSIRGLDPAFIRRFDMVFELPIPPKTQRERILRSSCGGLLDTSRISSIAEAEALAPAVVAKASSVIRLIQEDLGPKKTAAALERLISGTMEAQGHGPLLLHDPNRLPEVYDPRFIHADVDLAAVAIGLASTLTLPPKNVLLS
jgi:transitional endoplasmic reticulum ATPase